MTPPSMTSQAGSRSDAAAAAEKRDPFAAIPGPGAGPRDGRTDGSGAAAQVPTDELLSAFARVAHAAAEGSIGELHAVVMAPPLEGEWGALAEALVAVRLHVAANRVVTTSEADICSTLERVGLRGELADDIFMSHGRLHVLASLVGTLRVSVCGRLLDEAERATRGSWAGAEVARCTECAKAPSPQCHETEVGPRLDRQTRRGIVTALSARFLIGVDSNRPEDVRSELNTAVARTAAPAARADQDALLRRWLGGNPERRLRRAFRDDPQADQLVFSSATLLTDSAWEGLVATALSHGDARGYLSDEEVRVFADSTAIPF